MHRHLPLLCLFICFAYQVSAQCPRQTIIDNYQNKYLPSNFTDTELNWTGNSTDCTVGTMAESVQAKHLQKINYYRELVGGLNPISLEAVKNSKAMAAVLMYEAENNYGHCSGRDGAPCNTWACTSADAIEASAQSNIAFSFPNWNVSGPIDLYMRDDGDFNEAVPHRRWILHSRAQEMGIATSTRFNAMYVIDDFAATPTYDDFIAYPPTYIPQPLVPNRWSFSIPNADFSNASVTLSTSSGSAIPTTITERNINFYADNSIVWEPSEILTNETRDVTYTITVSNIENAPQSSYTYTSTIIPISAPVCPNGESFVPTTCQCEVVVTCPDGITLTSQEEVDAFAQDYPNCTRINGALIIKQGIDKTPIVNLNGLSNITEIRDGLGIEGTQLVDLEGLNQLTRAEGAVHIFDNLNLISLNGLNKLSYIGSDLSLAGNIRLNNISSLSSLTTIKRELIIFSNTALSSLNGLHNIERIESALAIFEQPLLESLEGLAGLNYVGEAILISNNETLSVCDNDNFCTIINTKNSAELQITSNAVGCNSVAEIIAVCNPSMPTVCNDNAVITIDSAGASPCISNPFLFETDETASGYTWDFGNSSPLENSTNSTFTNYDTPGVYTIKVFLTYENGCLDTATTQLVIGDPTSTFTYILDGNTITLTADATDPTGVTSYDWDFGDGAIASGLTPQTTYTYASPGTYLVSLTRKGLCETTTSVSIMVGEITPENTNSACTDGMDNDGDGQVDANDPNCECILTDGVSGCCDSYELSVELTPTPIGFADGKININFTGTLPDLNTYEVQAIDPLNFFKTNDGFVADNLSAGTYTFVVADKIDNGCNHSFTAEIKSLSCDDLTLNIATTSIDCGLTRFTANVNGGTPPYQYNWPINNSNTENTFISADPYIGPQSLVVIDANDCVISESYIVPPTSINVQSDFSYVITADSILFTNNSTGEFNDQQWTFNMPGMIVENRIALPPVGIYEVCLIVSNNCDQSNTQCQTIEIIETLPTNTENTLTTCSDGIDNDGDGLIDLLDESCAFARCGNLEIIPQNPRLPDNKYCDRTPIQFNASGGDLVLSQEWDYGNGRTSNFSSDAPQAIFSGNEVYNAAGIYVVKLKATFPDGCVDSTSYEIEIISSEPSFTYEVSEDGLTYTFTADQTNDDYINAYEWEIIDEELITSSGPTLIHTFSATGNYNVKLRVNGDCTSNFNAINIDVIANIPENTLETCSDGVDNDGDGLIDELDEDCAAIRCGNLEIFPPTPRFPDNKYCDRTPIQFNVAGGDQVLSHEWDYGNGRISNFSSDTPQAIVLGNETYNTPGVYVVKLKATFPDGCVDSTSYELEIISSEPSFTYEVSEDGLTYTFTADQTNDDYINSYEWEIIDEELITSSGPTLIHTFSATGNYNIKLRVNGDCTSNFNAINIEVVANIPENTLAACSDGIDNDGDGLIDELDEDCAVIRCGSLKIFPPTPRFPDNKYCDRTPIQFNVTGGDQVLSHEWDYGNGRISNFNSTTPQAIVLGNEIYNKPGVYVVKLKATFPDGCVDSTSYELEIISSEPEIIYEVAEDGLTYTFTADQTNDDYINSYEWEIIDDDLIISSGPTLIYTFSSIGNYNVKLRVTGDCTSNFSTVNINVETNIPGDTSFADADMDNVLSNVDPDDNDPCIPNNKADRCDRQASAPEFISEYPWLADLIDFNNCTNQQITFYQTGPYIYIYIQSSPTDPNGILYNAAGQFYCAARADYNCLTAYNLTRIIDTWVCGTTPTTLIVDNDNDGSLSNVDPDDSDPCVPDNTSATCDTDTPEEGGTSAPPYFLPDYPWLSDLVDFEDCSETMIQVYRSSGYVYLFIETATVSRLYNSAGAAYCTNSTGYDCRSFYTVDEEIAQWNCVDSAPITTLKDNDNDGVFSDLDPDDTNPCIPDDSACQDIGEGNNGAPTFLADYPWLSDLVDFDNCSNETIQVYRSNGYVYLFITTANSSILYNNSGLRYCTNSANYDCRVFYTMDEEIDFWSCGDAAPVVLLTDTDNDGYLSDVDSDDMDPCVPDDSSTACQALSGDFPPLFDKYPWLATLINPFNCTTDQVSVHSSGNYQYVIVEQNGSTIMYNEAGLTYCTSSPGYDCIDLYNLQEVVDSWVCGNALKEDCVQHPELCIDSHSLKTSKTERIWDFSIFPNPTTGQFSIELASTNSPQIISIINIQGQKIYQSNRAATAVEEVISIDLKDAVKGIYLVQIQSNTELVTQRLIIN